MAEKRAPETGSKNQILPEKVKLGGDFPYEPGEGPDLPKTHKGTEEADYVHVTGVNPARIHLGGGDDLVINDHPLLEINGGAGDDGIRTVPVPRIRGGEGRDILVYKMTSPDAVRVGVPEAAENFEDELKRIARADVRGIEQILYDTGDGKPKTFGVFLAEISPKAEDLSFLKPSIAKIKDISQSVADWVRR